MSLKNNCPADAAHELIAELHRNPDLIPPYNAELLKQSAEKVRQLYAEIYAAVQLLKQPDPPSNIAPTVFAKQAVIDRIKRCCCTYVEIRKDRLKRLRWQLGGILTDDIKQNLSAEELEWFSSYSRNISNFQCTIGGVGINLLDHSRPPKKLFRQVKVLKDYGEHETWDGNIKLLKKDSVHHMLWTDCERLVQRGILQVVESASLK